MTQIGLGRYVGGVRNTPAFDVWLLHRVQAGWSAQAIATASGGLVSVRSAYRWKAEFVRFEEVRVGNHVAMFAIRRTRPPARIEAWRVAS